MFKAGQRVVCVNPSWEHYVKGRVYTVMAAEQCGCGRCYVFCVEAPHHNGDALCCCGRRHTDYPPRHGDFAHTFRPVDELFDQIERIEKEGVPAELLEEVEEHMELCMN